MTDVDSTNNVSDVVGQPNQSQKGASSDQPNSPIDLEALVEKLRPMIEKTVQSTKDRRFSKLEEALMERVANQAADSKPQAEVPSPEGKATPPKESNAVQPSPVGKPDEVTEAEGVLLKHLGLDVSDPAVASVKNLPVSQRIMEYGKIIQRRAEPPAPSATIPQPGAQVVSKDVLAEELLKWQRNDPLDKAGNQARIKQELGI